MEGRQWRLVHASIDTTSLLEPSRIDTGIRGMCHGMQVGVQEGCAKDAGAWQEQGQGQGGARATESCTRQDHLTNIQLRLEEEGCNHTVVIIIVIIALPYHSSRDAVTIPIQC